MVITDEFKFPRPLDWSKFTDLRQVKEVYGISAVLPIKHIQQRRWYKTNEERPAEEQTDDVGLALQQMVDQVNASLEAHDVKIHIALLRRDEGFALEIYDCTDLEVCRIVRDAEINISELPVLLKNLQEGAGLLVDTET